MKKSNNHFRTINRRVMYLTDRIARYNAEEKTAPIFDISEREALIWAVDTIRAMAQRLLNMGRLQTWITLFEKLQLRVKELEEENRKLKCRKRR